MATYKVDQEGPVNALALNRDNTQVAIGGRNVFRVYQIQEDGFREVHNLRSSKHLNLGFSCNDVAWNGSDDNCLATAATNGHVCVWNLTERGRAMQEHVYHEHKRTVNKVNFHTSEPNRLISGSQDGTMRYFDIRCKTAVAVFISNTESVRDVQFSPHAPYTFAAVSENGGVQLWDVRRTDRCQQQFTAHNGPVFACDWHPDCTWLATASRDKTIKVWDLTTSKPTLENTIHTIASIGHVKWRPQRKYHIASCALVVDCSINIWDVRRPYIPFASFNEHKDITSGVAWRGDPHIFLSTGRDCALYQHSFKDAFRPASKANPQGMSLNNRDDVLYAYRVPASSTQSFPKTAGLIVRKTSTTIIPGDQFHIASSALHQFRTNSVHDTNHFQYLATHYVLAGKPFVDICDHNAQVAKVCGKNNVSVIWRIIKTMYSEEFQPAALDATNMTFGREDMSNPTQISNPVLIDSLHDNEQCPGESEAPAAQLSVGDEEAEAEDQVDHIGAFTNGFRSNFRLTPKGDFSFGENELDLELDKLTLDFRNNIRNPPSIQPYHQNQDWTLPNEAFHIRHEIQDRPPPAPSSSIVAHSNQPADSTINNSSVGGAGDSANNSSGNLRRSLAAGGGGGSVIGGGGGSNSSNSDMVPQTVSDIKIVLPTTTAGFWDPSAIVCDALRHQAAMGDIQTAASILTILGEHRKRLTALSDAVQEQWMLGYIELLGRCKLWNISTLIIKLCWLPAINQLNQQSTRFKTNCGRCGKPYVRSGWHCDRCSTTPSPAQSTKRGSMSTPTTVTIPRLPSGGSAGPLTPTTPTTPGGGAIVEEDYDEWSSATSSYPATAAALCSICHKVVKGLYVWCQGCAHGGHLLHMQAWMRENKQCPTGCGHQCEYR